MPRVGYDTDLEHQSHVADDVAGVPLGEGLAVDVDRDGAAKDHVELLLAGRAMARSPADGVLRVALQRQESKYASDAPTADDRCGPTDRPAGGTFAVEGCGR